MRKSVVATIGKYFGQHFIHFTGPAKLQGIDCNLRMPLATDSVDNAPFEQIEALMMANRIAHNVTSIKKLRGDAEEAVYEIVYNTWVHPDKNEDELPESPVTVAQLPHKVIDAINTYLTEVAFSDGFDSWAIDSLVEPRITDPLRLMKHVPYVRGYFVAEDQRSRLSRLYKNEKGSNVDDLMDVWLEENGYTQDERLSHKPEIRNARNEFKKGIAQHAVILRSGKDSSKTPILYLNKDFEPVFVGMGL